MGTITLEQIHDDLIGLRRDMSHIKALVEEDFELADDVIVEIEASRKKPKNKFISHDSMRKEFS